MDLSGKNKALYLFVILSGIFVANAILAEFIGVKIFSLERSLGMEPVHWSIFGVGDLSFNLTAGVLLWPLIFVLTDIINEYYGPKGVRFLSYLTAALIVLAFGASWVAIRLVRADFWPTSHLGHNTTWATDVLNLNSAYRLIFGQGAWIIVGSLTAFLIGQWLDVTVFHKIKKITGEKSIWFRSTGSTLVSQLLDSFIVLFIAFYIGASWPLETVLAIGCINYLYKFLVALLMTPLIYLVHDLIERFLGHDIAESMKIDAMKNE